MKKVKQLFKLTCVLIIGLIVLSHTNVGNLSHTEIPQNHKSIEIQDNLIRYTQLGKGKDILLIHGTPGSIEDWNAVTKELSLNYRVTSFDRFGHGYTQSEDYHYTIAENAEFVKALINELNLNDPMIIGHSYGGSIIAHLISDHYNDTLTYMIIDSPLYNYEPSLIYKLLATPIIGKAIGLIANYTIAGGQIESGIIAAVANQTNEQLNRIIEERKQIWLQPKVLHSKAKESINYQNNLNEILPKYKAIASKVIVVSGANKEITFKDDAERFSMEVQTDSLVIISNTGHYIQLDQRDRITELIINQMDD